MIGKIIGAIIFAVIAYAVYPSGIADIPFAQLTLEKIGGLIGSVCFGVMAFKVLFDDD